jgi:hypothetical protein
MKGRAYVPGRTDPEIWDGTLLKLDPSSILFIIPPFLLTLSTQVQQVCLIDVIKYKSFRKKERGKFNIF